MRFTKRALVRFRPIIMTTLAAMLGAIPLMLGFGTGSELRQPLGVAIFGGLVISQILTLFSTPVIYLALDRVFHKNTTRRRSPRRRPSCRSRSSRDERPHVVSSDICAVFLSRSRC